MSAKIPLILLPGLLCDEAIWAGPAASLGKYTEITIPALTGHDSITAMAAHVLAGAPLRFTLAGLSMGGYVALEIMRQAPERVLKLMLADTSARADTEEQKARRRGLMQLAQKGRFSGVTPRLLPQLLHPDHLQNAGMAQIIMDMAQRIGREAYLRQQNAILSRIDSRPFLKNIACPTLIIVGREDALTPPAIAEEMSVMISGARLSIIENCGHLSPLECPETVANLIASFLNF